MSRLMTGIAALWAAIALALPALAQGTLENDTNRYGGDYLSVRAQSVHECRDRCRSDTRCMSWTFEKRKPNQSSAVCHLKNYITAPSANTCCISGVIRNTRALVNRTDFNTNRPGGDYARVSTSNTDALGCRDSCDRDPRCVAWTWVRPGHQGSNTVCWLKSSVPGRVWNTCCLSGVKSER
jgi:hypothetical protein